MGLLQFTLCDLAAMLCKCLAILFDISQQGVDLVSLQAITGRGLIRLGALSAGALT